MRHILLEVLPELFVAEVAGEARRERVGRPLFPDHLPLGLVDGEGGRGGGGERVGRAGAVVKEVK